MTLFIGGPLDGTERHLERDRMYYEVLERFAGALCAAPELTAYMEARDLRKVRYLRYRVYDCDFCVPDNVVVPNDLMKILLAAYPRKR